MDIFEFILTIVLLSIFSIVVCFVLCTYFVFTVKRDSPVKPTPIVYKPEIIIPEIVWDPQAPDKPPTKREQRRLNLYNFFKEMKLKQIKDKYVFMYMFIHM